MVDAGRLLVRLEGRVWKDLPLVQRVLSIGREPSNDLALPDPRVSRHHAELRLESHGPVLTDLGSSSGTFLEAARLLADQPHAVAGGDTFSIGPFALTYVAPEQLQEGHPDGARSLALSEEASPNGRTAARSRSTPALPARRERSAIRPPGPPPGQPSRYLADLPALFQESDFLGRYLLIFESIWELLEQRQDHIDMYFDPRSCPASFLPWLAGWLGLSFHPHSARPVSQDGLRPLESQDGLRPLESSSPESRIHDEGRQRDLLAAATDLYRWRGTRHGLERMIELATGVTPHITDDPSDPFVVHISLRIAPDFPLDEQLLHGLIEAHKPAHAGYTLDVTR